MINGNEAEIMNIDGTKLSEIFDINNKINKNASVQAGSVEFVNGAEAFFDEDIIKSSQDIGDAYDRVVKKAEVDKTGDMAITGETINKIAEVVTPEDFSKYEELGIIPDKDNPESILTVSDRIEIELATHCDNYRPTGNISISDLEEMYGDRASQIKETLDKIENLQPINREVSEYLLVNDMDLSIDNVYSAEYSVNNNGKSKERYEQLTDEEWNELQPQIENLLNKSGFDVNEDNVSNAKWMIENKIPVTPKNLYKLNKIDRINTTISEGEISQGEWIDKITINMQYGLTAGSVSADYYSGIEAESAEAVEIINNGTDEQITVLVSDGKEVTLLNMKRQEEENTYRYSEERKGDTSEEIQRKIITERKNLEELRLKMTVEASAVMIKNGINIEISTLSELVDELKKMEKEYVTAVFNATGNVADDENVKLFSETRNYMDSLTRTPSYVLGSVLNNDIDFEIEDMVVEGAVKENVLKSAQIAYDTLGTKPDRELGDSINKAFSGIDEILENMNMENNSENQRAVRILAYNEMEIDEKNINEIKNMDREVTRLIDNLTPRTTAYLISNGINPLKTDISELNDELDKINEEIGIDEVEKYSEFLWKLDKNKKISEEDREAYIGIYRLIRMVEKGDRKAVGAVIKQGSEVNMKNLLTAARSIKNTGNSIKVDDNLGLMDEIKKADNNIDNQLELFERREFVERAVDTVSQEIYTEESIMDYNSLRVEEMRGIETISEETLLNLYEDGTVVNNENILGAAYYVINGGKTFSKIKEICEDDKVNKDLERLSGILEDTIMEDVEYEISAGISDNVSENSIAADVTYLETAVNNMTEDVKRALLDKAHIDVRDIRMVNRMMNYMRNAAKKTSYYVPTDINGKISTVKITIESGESEKGKVTIGMKDLDIKAEFTVNNENIKGLIMTDSNAIKNYDEFYEEFKNHMKNMGLTLKYLNKTEDSYVKTERMNSENNNIVSTNTLFKVAKVYISDVKKYV